MRERVVGHVAGALVGRADRGDGAGEEANASSGESSLIDLAAWTRAGPRCATARPFQLSSSPQSALSR